MNSPSNAQMASITTRCAGTIFLLFVALMLALSGCEKREKVLDVKAPGIDLEIDKKTDLDGNQSFEVEQRSP